MKKRTDRIVFIMTDTQRADMVGCYGNPQMQTPCLDRLASEGIRFDQAHCCQPVCGPARAGLFTGIWPHTNGSWANTMPLGEGTRTIGQRLQAHGIHTGYIGKWHLDGGDYFGYGECPDGWDPKYWYDMRRYLEEMPEEDRLRSRKAETSFDPDFNEDFTFAHGCSDRAVDFLEKHGDERFFLVVSYDEPHAPSLCPPEYVEMHAETELPRSRNVFDTLEGKPSHQKAWAGDNVNQDRESTRIKRPQYFGCNSFVDHQVGRVLEAVNEHAPNALVIYTSDHGDALESHCIDNKGPVMYEEITRIPWIIRWPGVSPAAAVCPHPVSHIDIVPTILEAFGLPAPKPLHGSSILDTFADPGVKPANQIFMEFGRYEIDHDGFGGFQPIRCAFDGRYKLVINLMCEDELYDLRDDPDEMENLIESDDHAKIRDNLHDRIIDWMNETRDPFRGYYWERRPWRTDARAATWDYTAMTRQKEEDENEPRQLDYDTGLEMKHGTRPKS